MKELKKRIDFVYIYDVQDGNPNGDPDAGNLPRVDAETGHGIVTDVCLKRKIRNYIEAVHNNEPGCDIFIRKAVLPDTMVEAIYETEAVKSSGKDKQKYVAQQALCQKYFDIRTFGAVIATKDKQGQVKGPVQMTFGRSVDPIISINHAITRVSGTKSDTKVTDQTIGRKATVPYALYVAYGFVNVCYAKNTGFGENDLDLLWEALINMFDFDRSASKGLMSARKLIVFEHNTERGVAPANKLIELVHIDRKPDVCYPRKISDYDIHIDTDNIPDGVTVKNLI